MSFLENHCLSADLRRIEPAPPKEDSRTAAVSMQGGDAKQIGSGLRPPRPVASESIKLPAKAGFVNQKVSADLATSSGKPARAQ